MTQIIGGAALPVSVVTTHPLSGMALPVYGYDTAPDRAQGGPAFPVYVVSAAEIASGAFRVGGGPAVPVYIVAAGQAVQGGPALPVYPVNSWPT